MHSTVFAIRFGAIASALSAATTVLLWLLPRLNSVSSDPVAKAGVVVDPLLLGRLWVNLGHVIIALAAYAAAALVASRRSPAFAWAGLAAFGAWALTEAIGVSVNLWAVNMTWQPAYLTASPHERAALAAAILTAEGIWDGLFFVVLITFLLGTLLMGLSLAATGGLARAVAVLLLLAMPLTLVIILDSYFAAHLSAWVAWLYPILQPASRSIMAVWLWRAAPLFSDPKADI